jgi:hypothetical protein
MAARKGSKKLYRHSTTGMYATASTPPAGRAWVEQTGKEAPEAPKPAHQAPGAATGVQKGPDTGKKD